MLWHFGDKLLKLILEEFALQKKLPKSARKGWENPTVPTGKSAPCKTIVGEFTSKSPTFLKKRWTFSKKRGRFSEKRRSFFQKRGRFSLKARTFLSGGLQYSFLQHLLRGFYIGIKGKALRLKGAYWSTWTKLKLENNAALCLYPKLVIRAL